MSEKIFKKTLFLDRDGVINVDKSYVYKIEDFEFEEFVVEDLKFIFDEGYQIIIITNQSGIARGYYTVKEYKKLTKYYLNIFKANKIHGVKVLFCPHHPEGKIKRYATECECRKPGLKLFEKAIKKYNVDINNSIVVGDSLRDLELTKKYPQIKGYLFKTKSGNYETISRLKEIIK